MDRPVLLRLVSSTTSLNTSPPDLACVGAVDSTIVTNVSLIEWHEVVPFEPVGSGNNVSSYLEWAIPISTITVRFASFSSQPMLTLEITGRNIDFCARGYIPSSEFQSLCCVV